MDNISYRIKNMNCYYCGEEVSKEDKSVVLSLKGVDEIELAEEGLQLKYIPEQIAHHDCFEREGNQKTEKECPFCGRPERYEKLVRIGPDKRNEYFCPACRFHKYEYNGENGWKTLRELDLRPNDSIWLDEDLKYDGQLEITTEGG